MVKVVRVLTRREERKMERETTRIPLEVDILDLGPQGFLTYGLTFLGIDCSRSRLPTVRVIYVVCTFGNKIKTMRRN